MTPQQNTAASAEDIRAILGPLDEQTLRLIEGTGASLGEIGLAQVWLYNDGYMHAWFNGFEGNDRILAVYRLLLEEQGAYYKTV